MKKILIVVAIVAALAAALWYFLKKKPANDKAGGATKRGAPGEAPTADDPGYTDLGDEGDSPVGSEEDPGSGGTEDSGWEGEVGSEAGSPEELGTEAYGPGSMGEGPTASPGYAVKPKFEAPKIAGGKGAGVTGSPKSAPDGSPWTLSNSFGAAVTVGNTKGYNKIFVSESKSFKLVEYYVGGKLTTWKISDQRVKGKFGAVKVAK